MTRIVHSNSSGLVTGTSTIYDKGEEHGLPSGCATVMILYGIIAIKAIQVIHHMLIPFLG